MEAARGECADWGRAASHSVNRGGPGVERGQWTGWWQQGSGSLSSQPDPLACTTRRPAGHGGCFPMHFDSDMSLDMRRITAVW